MYRKVPSWRAGLRSKVNEGKVTEWMQLKWRLTIFYISPVLLSAARFKKKKEKSRVYLPSAASSAAPASTCFPQFTENYHHGILLRFRLGNAHSSMGNVVQSVFIFSSAELAHSFVFYTIWANNMGWKTSENVPKIFF